MYVVCFVIVCCQQTVDIQKGIRMIPISFNGQSGSHAQIRTSNNAKSNPEIKGRNSIFFRHDALRHRIWYCFDNYFTYFVPVFKYCYSDSRNL